MANKGGFRRQKLEMVNSRWSKKQDPVRLEQNNQLHLAIVFEVKAVKVIFGEISQSVCVCLRMRLD